MNRQTRIFIWGLILLIAGIYCGASAIKDFKDYARELVKWYDYLWPTLSAIVAVILWNKGINRISISLKYKD
ncbi:MAG TPA: hypothetical protein PLG47_05455 [Candidatus Dojkabacteria bacterium]|nr:hypothetical protein [Candidatus Dojkabacteria bacterium]